MSVISALRAGLWIGVGASSADGPDRDQLSQLVEAAQASICGDVSFDYDGGLTVAGQVESPMTCTGSFAHRSDGATLVEIYQFERPRPRAIHSIVAIRGQTSELATQADDRARASITIKPVSPFGYAGPASFRKIWLADLVKILAATRYLYRFEGYRKADSGDVAVVRFILSFDEATARGAPSWVFRIDLGRGGHVTRFEERYDGDELGGLTLVTLDRFERRPGVFSWLPASGSDQSFITAENRKMGFSREPISTTAYRILPKTIRFDRSLPDGCFSAQAPRKDRVGDEMSKAARRFAESMAGARARAPAARPPSDAAIQANLDRLLDDPSVMARELKATSPAREGRGWLSYWPWMTASAAVASIALIAWRRR